jgi:uncharacterized surface anchored protein
MLLSFLLLSGTYSLPSFAQSTCPVTTLSVATVKGKVVSQGKIEVPVSGTKIELFRMNDEALVESVLTDENGFFKIANVKNGKYRLVVWFTIEGATYLKYNLILKVKKNRKENNQMVYIRLGMDCFSSDAKLIDEKNCPDS